MSAVHFAASPAHSAPFLASSPLSLPFFHSRGRSKVAPAAGRLFFPLLLGGSSTADLWTLLHRSLPSARSRSLPLYSCVSSKIDSEKEVSMVMDEGCLLIVGPGVLGKLVAEKWQQDYPHCQIVGHTMTTDHHNELARLGINPFLKGRSDMQYPYIIFCAPPKSADYLGDVRVALSNWNGEGSFLFTSSTAVYDGNDNGLCNEESPIVPIGRSPRTDVLLKAEKLVLDAGGCVLRLAGLYNADRGAHIYALEKGVIDADPDHVLNFIHYEDAASLAIGILKRKLRDTVFLGCDNHPQSWGELMDCVNRSEKYNKKIVSFTGSSDKLGKKMNNSSTRAEIGWEPKYPSFPSFLGLTKTSINHISKQG